jgi:diguanylate cyclase (GGDEF)-like protein
MATSELAILSPQAFVLGEPAYPAGGASYELEKLLEGFASRLQADLAAVILRDERLRVRYKSHQRSSKNAGKLMDQLETDLEHWLKAAQRLLVQNDSATAGNQHARLSHACKLVAAPVLLAGDGPDGIVVVVNPPSAPDFTSRDASLVKALAATVSEIVQSHYDSATGLMTRKEFEFVLDDALRTGSRSTTRHCLLYLDLDELQLLEDSLGREARDELVWQVAQQLKADADENAEIARIGEDEFAILLRDCTLKRGFCVGQELRRAISSLNVVWNDKPIKITASIGVTQLVPGTGTRESTLAAARIACITAKEDGRDRVKAFWHDDAVRLNDQRRESVIARIQAALQSYRFLLYSQAIKPLWQRARVQHLEVLIKGIDDDGEPIPPSEFIPYAEQSKIMPELDRWVVRHSLEALASDLTSEQAANAIVSINLSGQSLCDDGFLDFVVDQLERTKVPATSICFELTETAAILNMERARSFMATLTRHGCRFSLDDFGAGLSSFSYLRTLPVSFLKIDGQFVRDIVDDPVCNAMVAAIHQMSHAMGLQTIAEYVETPAIKQHLREIGIDYGQGDAIAKPRLFSEALASLSG